MPAAEVTPPRANRALRYALFTGATLFSIFLVIARGVPNGLLASERAKGALAAFALAALIWEHARRKNGAPIDPRVVRRRAIAFGIASVALWFSGALFSYSGYFHVWDQYHYVIGSKYFPELRYDGLYRCSVVALDQRGSVTQRLSPPLISQTFDLHGEVTAPDYFIRDVDRTNELIPATAALADSAQCIKRFTPDRWKAFSNDVLFFRLAADAKSWRQMTRDHGYNPPPPWTAVGGTIASIMPASRNSMVILALLDPVLILAAFAALWWAFGWKTASLGAVFWGTQAFSPYFWTGGAFLRHDWFFLTVLSVCLAKRRHNAWSGAALAAAACFRVFPVLLAMGWVVMLLDPRTRRRQRAVARNALAGGFATAIILLSVGAAAAGPRAYPEFTRHIRLHNATPLSNEIGLRPLASIRPSRGPESGRMKDLIDQKQVDQSSKWRESRLDRWRRSLPVVALLSVLALLIFVHAVRCTQRTWIVPGLSTLWIVLLAQLTGYYYSFLLITAPLARVQSRMALLLVGLAALSQLASALGGWTDDRHVMFSALCIAFVVAVNGQFVVSKIGGAIQHQ